MIVGGWQLSTIYICETGGAITPQWTGPDRHLFRQRFDTEHPVPEREKRDVSRDWNGDGGSV